MHIRTKHPVMLLTDKSQPETNADRLVILRWKGNKETGRVAHSARCFSVPIWQPALSGTDHHYLPMLVEAFNERQRQIAHKYVTAELDRNGGVCNDIPADLLEPAKVLEDWEADETDTDSRGKLSAEAINAWFDARLSDVLQLALLARMTFAPELSEDQQVAKIKQSANNYKKLLAMLAAPSSSVTIDQAKLLNKAIQLLPNEVKPQDAVYGKLNKKLTGIISKGENLLDAL